MKWETGSRNTASCLGSQTGSGESRSTEQLGALGSHRTQRLSDLRWLGDSLDAETDRRGVEQKNRSGLE